MNQRSRVLGAQSVLSLDGHLVLSLGDSLTMLPYLFTALEVGVFDVAALSRMILTVATLSFKVSYIKHYFFFKCMVNEHALMD